MIAYKTIRFSPARMIKSSGGERSLEPCGMPTIMWELRRLLKMTFKDMLFWSRHLTYKQLNRIFIRCVNNDQFRAAQAFNSMCWLSSFRRTNSHNKITMWKYAVLCYKAYKYHPWGAIKMTFKAVRILARSMTYSEIALRYSKCVRNKLYKSQYLYLSMLWLNLFPGSYPDEKIIKWVLAVRAYKLYRKASWWVFEN